MDKTDKQGTGKYPLIMLFEREIKKERKEYDFVGVRTSYPSTLSGMVGRASQLTSICAADTLLALTLLGATLGTAEIEQKCGKNPTDSSNTITHTNSNKR